MTDHGFRFPRELRLLKAGQFKAVFSNSTYKVSDRDFLVLARRNELDAGRLGLVIGKKHLPKAVQRNRIKRLLRTSFRLHQDLLTGLDIVILARSNMKSLDNRELLENVQKLWTDLARKASSNSRYPQSTSGRQQKSP